MNFLFYRYRFLLLYIIFGFISLSIELMVIRSLSTFNTIEPIKTIFSFFVGLIVAFILNIRFNFHIAQPKRKRALIYFTVISSVSFCIQLLFRKELIHSGMSMDLSRFLISGVFFIFSYFLHRKFSFKEYKKVGVAIYADGVEDIKKIYDKISNVCDFIHIDIVDKSFNLNANDVKAYRAEVVRAYWQDKPIEVHIMSKNPSIWLDELLPYVDIIYIHTNIDENIDNVLEKINQGGCSPGIALSLGDKVENIYPFLSKINHVLLLAIKQPGFSGQKFDMDILPYIETLDGEKHRNNIKICLDGGVNNSNIGFLNVDSVVSGSFVLNSKDPIRSIMYLQTSGEYEKF